MRQYFKWRWQQFKRLFRKRQHDKGWQCPKCFLKRPFKGSPDPCLGYLPGIKYACCGHGDPHRYGEAYFFFTNGKIIRIYGEISVEEHTELEFNGDVGGGIPYRHLDIKY